jgi:hypothetical protein
MKIDIGDVYYHISNLTEDIVYARVIDVKENAIFGNGFTSISYYLLSGKKSSRMIDIVFLETFLDLFKYVEVENYTNELKALLNEEDIREIIE